VPSSAGLWRVDETVGAVTEGDFQFSARVTAGFASTFDAGVLLLWLDERRWAKLCFEFSPAGEPMVVSVVCRGVSDDANAFAVRGRSVWLRVSRVDRVYAYHASLDGRAWQMIRVFVLDDETSRDKIGFEGQSPTGEGCSVTFDEIRFLPKRVRLVPRSTRALTQPSASSTTDLAGCRLRKSQSTSGPTSGTLRRTTRPLSRATPLSCARSKFSWTRVVPWARSLCGSTWKSRG
jgi:regulation of enolase protein 1 (concanavalin A-like superfamily)